MTRTAIYSFLSGASCAVFVMVAWVRFGGDVPLHPEHAATPNDVVRVEYIDRATEYTYGTETIEESVAAENSRRNAIRDRVRYYLLSMPLAEREEFLRTLTHTSQYP